MSYNSNSSNSPRVVSFLITNSAASNANIFALLSGAVTANRNPSALEELAQVRTNLIIQALSQRHVVTDVRLAKSANSTETMSAGLIVTFEDDGFGSAYVNDWALDTVSAKFSTSAAGGIGRGGMSLKNQPMSLEDHLNTIMDVSYDGGASGPFGGLSLSGTVTLPSGRVATGAPATGLIPSITYIKNEQAVPTYTVPGAITAPMWTVVDAESGLGNQILFTLVTAPANGGTPITGYDVRFGTDPWQPLGLNGGTRTFEVDSGVALSVQIRAVNAIGEGPASDTKTVTATNGE